MDESNKLAACKIRIEQSAARIGHIDVVMSNSW